MWNSGCFRCLRRSLPIVYLVFFFVMLYLSMFGSDKGITFLAQTQSYLLAKDLETPVSQRGMLWQAKHVLTLLFLAKPLYFKSFHEDRITMFRKLQEVNGDVHATSTGLAFHSYAAASESLKSTNQSRGQYVGSLRVPDGCLDTKYTLIYISTGAEHTEMRNFMLRHIPGYNKDHSGFTGPVFLGNEDDAGGDVVPSTSTLLRTVTRNVWTRMFDQKPSDEHFEIITNFPETVLKCLPGETAEMRKQMDIMRRTAYKAALSTDVGKTLLDKLVTELGKSEEDAKHRFESLVESTVMFAGWLGTWHLTRVTFERIKSDPKKYVPMWKRSPNKFLLECARLSPSVASVTNLFTTDREIEVGRGFGKSTIHVEKGTPVQLVLTSANVDPAVFGGKNQSSEFARSFAPFQRSDEEFEKILAFNGVHNQVMKGTAPRMCLGTDLGVDIAWKIIDHFIPALEKMDTSDTDASSDQHNRPAWILMCIAAAAYLWSNPNKDRKIVVQVSLFLAAEACTDIAPLLNLHLVEFLAEMVKFYAIIQLHFVLLGWARFRGQVPVEEEDKKRAEQLQLQEKYWRNANVVATFGGVLLVQFFHTELSDVLEFQTLFYSVFAVDLVWMYYKEVDEEIISWMRLLAGSAVLLIIAGRSGNQLALEAGATLLFSRAAYQAETHFGKTLHGKDA